MNTLLRRLTAMAPAVGSLALSWSATAARAQENGAAGGTQVVQGRSYVIEIGLVLLLFGAALFAVCKASRRA